MKEMWNERYSNNTYAYGVEPNLFFANTLKKLQPGKILLPAEGEGRNAVFAAKLGWKVVAFDISEMGRNKALSLAKKEKVEIDYRVASYNDFSKGKELFDCIALVFAHMPADQRKIQHKKLIQYLKPEGILILEAFSKEQINNNTGGPKSNDFLFSQFELESDFYELKESKIETIQQDLFEGEFHNGKSDLIRLVGIK